MIRDRVLLALTFIGSAICWWPAIVEPGVDFPRRMLLALVALMAGASTALLGGRWQRVMIASALGTFAGLFSGALIWPPHDGIAASYSGIVAIIAMVAAGAASLVAGLGVSLAVGKMGPLNRASRAGLWVVMGCCVAVGPVGLALTPPLVARRVARNDAVAEKRFTALKAAIEETWAEPGGADRVCSGRDLQAHYSGPPFSDGDWSRIVGNYVEEDSYIYMVSCREKHGYTIDVRTKMPLVYGYGSRIFCTDESKRIGCGPDHFWNGWPTE